MGNRYTCKQTFEEWCINNNRRDLLDLWDYDINSELPSEIPSGTKKRYYFKCPKDIHASETKRILDITDSPNHQIICKECVGISNGDKIIDLTGKQFGELQVIGQERREGDRHIYWVCKCSCGNTISVQGFELKIGKKTACGGKWKHKLLDCTNTEHIFDPYNSKCMMELRGCKDYYAYRQAVIQKDNGECIVCGSQNNIEVHHIYPFALYPHDRFNPDTGVCMCKEHHSIGSPISFHSIYGLHNNTPEQLEEYVNIMRERLGIDEPFDVYQYMENIESDNMDIDDAMFLDLYE